MHTLVVGLLLWSCLAAGVRAQYIPRLPPPPPPVYHPPVILPNVQTRGTVVIGPALAFRFPVGLQGPPRSP